jgi:hypothetical protein
VIVVSPMNVQVTAASREEQARVAALFELYVYDLSDVLGIDVGEDGRRAGTAKAGRPRGGATKAAPRASPRRPSWPTLP